MGHHHLPRCRSCCWVVQRAVLEVPSRSFWSHARSRACGGANVDGGALAIDGRLKEGVLAPLPDQKYAQFLRQHRTARASAFF